VPYASGKEGSFILMEPADLRSDPLYVKVYTLLKKWIMEGRLQPGERIGETSLAVDLQVSRTPVRDALRRLEQDRLITPVPGPAYEVYRPTLEDLAGLYTARAILEGGVARLAAERQAPEIGEMAAILVAMAQAYDQHAASQLVELDMQFHELLVTAGGNPVLVELHSHLTNRLRLMRIISGDATARRNQILAQHAAIVAALRSGDGAAAEEATRAHIMAVFETARKNFVDASALRA